MIVEWSPRRYETDDPLFGAYWCSYHGEWELKAPPADVPPYGNSDLGKVMRMAEKHAGRQLTWTPSSYSASFRNIEMEVQRHVLDGSDVWEWTVSVSREGRALGVRDVCLVGWERTLNGARDTAIAAAEFVRDHMEEIDHLPARDAAKRSGSEEEQR